ncbi:hypothetical protein ZHAS_00018240 [Anopheles sinensis]|uniref:Uncharacterized protein n=1 Tax=Anopheles sinensis TaxID=74873 RepID=A0A084WIY2_ANOSI|nr:hypothetical protein ZHAS_00018240 [Anopheles sinensis]
MAMAVSRKLHCGGASSPPNRDDGANPLNSPLPQPTRLGGMGADSKQLGNMWHPSRAGRPTTRHTPLMIVRRPVRGSPVSSPSSSSSPSLSSPLLYVVDLIFPP